MTFSREDVLHNIKYASLFSTKNDAPLKGVNMYVADNFTSDNTIHYREKLYTLNSLGEISRKMLQMIAKNAFAYIPILRIFIQSEEEAYFYK